MSRLIIKLNDGKSDFYLEWSTIVDAPVTYGMSLEEFKEHYKKEYGEEGMCNLPQRLARVEKKGCSAFNKTLDELLSCNHAGDNEHELTKEEIIREYCTDKKSEPASNEEIIRRFYVNKKSEPASNSVNTKKFIYPHFSSIQSNKD